MEPIKDYDCTIDNHLGKANVVTNGSSKKIIGSLAYVQIVQLLLIVDSRKLGVKLRIHFSRALLASF